jgi:hypothetical protein
MQSFAILLGSVLIMREGETKCPNGKHAVLTLANKLAYIVACSLKLPLHAVRAVQVLLAMNLVHNCRASVRDCPHWTSRVQSVELSV